MCESVNIIERLVCSGGGAKGVVYPGAYKALVDAGVYKHVRDVSGASVGAITASLLALGITPDALREKLLNTTFTDLLGDLVKVKGPGITFLTRDGKPLENKIRELIIETTRTSFAELIKPPIVNDKLRTLWDKLQTAEPIITFADLDILHQHFPQKFKSLVVTAVRSPRWELQVFNSELTPNVEIALACRASSSIPVLLQPVTIQIDGVKYQFIDGGLYDNLPTDYFDRNEDEEFIRNLKPDNTLVFAFGDDQNKHGNEVFKAMYGNRWDETLNNEFLQHILHEALLNLGPEEEFKSNDDEANFIIKSTIKVLKKHLQANTLREQEYQVLKEAMRKVFKHLLLTLQENLLFWQTYRQAQKQKRSELLTNLIIGYLKPVLYDATFFEEFKRNFLVEYFGGFKLSFKNTIQKEACYQKIRSNYALRTVQLHVGDIKTTDFDKISKMAKIMDAVGYLDTINFLINYELHDAQVFNAPEFFDALTANFMPIYKAVLAGAGTAVEQDSLIIAIQSLQVGSTNLTPEKLCREIYYLIKDRVDKDFDSPEAFALSRALEFSRQQLSADDLFKEAYAEGFKRSSFFSMSKITGEAIFTNYTLKDQLKNHSMFQLYRDTDNKQNRRTEQVLKALCQIGSFAEEYHNHPICSA